jgi:hypothetical protein
MPAAGALERAGEIAEDALEAAGAHDLDRSVGQNTPP